MNGGVVAAMGSVDLPLLSPPRCARWNLPMAVAKSPLAAPARRLMRWARGS